MANIERVNLAANPIVEPLNAYRVKENSFAAAYHTDARPYMLTCGISPCKGITIHNGDTGLGLVAHLSVTPDLERTLCKLTSTMQSMSRAEICIVEAMRSPSPSWPTLDDITNFFMRKNPKALKIDQNDEGRYARGVALTLINGEVQEIDGSNGWTWSDEQDTSLNRYLYEVNLGY